MPDMKMVFKHLLSFSAGYVVGNRTASASMRKQLEESQEEAKNNALARENLVDELAKNYEVNITDQEKQIIVDAMKNKEVLEMVYLVMAERDFDESKYHQSSVNAAKEVMKILKLEEENKNKADSGFPNDYDPERTKTNVLFLVKYTSKYGEDEATEFIRFMINFLSKNHAYQLTRNIADSSDMNTVMATIHEMMSLSANTDRLGFLSEKELI